MAEEQTHSPAADNTPSPEAQKSQTSRISLDSARPAKPADGRKATGPIAIGAPHAPPHAPIPQTIRLKRPPTSPIMVPVSDRAEAKRQSAPIVVPAAKSASDSKRATGPIVGIPTHAAPIPQTIRLKRPSTTPVVRPPTGKTPAPAPLSRSEAPTLVKKAAGPASSTSRIVLEDARPAAAAGMAKQSTTEIPPVPAAPPETPRTIRLKAPATLAEAESGAGVDTTLQSAKKAETTKIELPPEEGAAVPLAQRKTIRIKRADAGAPARPAPPPPKRAPEAAPERASAADVQPAPADAETGMAWSAVAAAALICLAALAYLLAAQSVLPGLPVPAALAVP